MENFIGKKNGQIKGLVSNMWLILYYTTQLVLPYPTFVPNLKILSQVFAEKVLTKDVHMHYIGVRDGRIENLKKKAK